jgi:transposase
MFIRQTVKHHKGKTYRNYLLVESVLTPKGPRQKTICSLGSLAPAPRKRWLELARKVHDSLEGQGSLLEPDPHLETLAGKARSAKPRTPAPAPEEVLSVQTEGVRTEQPREAGPVHVGHQLWGRLGLNEILEGLGFSPRARVLTEAMTLNRLIAPASEHAMPSWMRRTALADILECDLDTLADDSLYRNLDRLHPERERIETELAAREKTLFNLQDTIYLYDLTSTYFEGRCPLNPQARRGYSRDGRPDCKQLVVGLVLDRDGFPRAHEVFEGNLQDRASLDGMLTALEKRTGRRGGGTVIVDRGMAYEENLEQIRAHGHHYLVAARQPERMEWLAEYEKEEGWEEVVRPPSPLNPAQKKSRVVVRRVEKGEEVHVLCIGEERVEKDRAIREKHEARLRADLERLQQRIARGHLKDEAKIHEAIGRLKERYPRVARYYAMLYDPESRVLRWEENVERKALAASLDGGYVLKTDRKDLSAEEIWRLYILLTRVEDAFRDMKSPLAERPIFHHLQHRAETHIFLCVLAYHLLVAIGKSFLDQGLHTSWKTLRETLSTHQVVTVVLPATNGGVLKIRKGTTPEPAHAEIYRVLSVPREVMAARKWWVRPPRGDSDGTRT